MTAAPLDPARREWLAHTLYNASCANECTLRFEFLPRLEAERWRKLADYLTPLLDGSALAEQDRLIREWWESAKLEPHSPYPPPFVASALGRDRTASQ